MVHHLTELGLRVPMDVVNSEVLDDEDADLEHSQFVDLAVKRMAEVIKKKREVFSNERLDNGANSKFTLSVIEEKQQETNRSKRETKSDFVLRAVANSTEEDMAPITL